VDRRVHERVHPLTRFPNPLRSEAEAFRFLGFFVAAVIVIVALIELIRAIS
jgi:hypothetical protein